MKKIFTLFALMILNTGYFGSLASAAELTLSGGESAVIRANTETRVTCGGGSNSGNCELAVSGLKTLVEACKVTYTAGYCIDKYWPNFKRDNPQCQYAGLSTCIDYCKITYTAGYCADKCSQ